MESWKIILGMMYQQMIGIWVSDLRTMLNFYLVSTLINNRWNRNETRKGISEGGCYMLHHLPPFINMAILRLSTSPDGPTSQTLL